MLLKIGGIHPMLEPSLEQDGLQKSLHQAVLFTGLGTGEIERIITAGQWQSVEQGRYIYQQGANERRFFLVARGEVELTVNVPGGGQLIVSHIGTGGHFGETSLLTGNSNSLNTRALTRVTLLWFDEETFNRVLLTNPVVKQQLSVALAQRLRLSFHDHAHTLAQIKNIGRNASHNLDPTFFLDQKAPATLSQPSRDSEREIRFAESTIARQIDKAVRRFSNNLEPVLLTGESGTGRRMVAYEIHRASAYKNGPYTEVDIRGIDPGQLEVELFGYERDSLAFSQVDQLGVFERLLGGTVVLYNAEYMEPDFQRELARTLKKASFPKVAGDTRVSLRSRIILICKDAPGRQDGHNRLLPSLYALFASQHFRAAPLREHRRDIPRLIQYYLKRYSKQYGKVINKIDDQTLGRFMNYDWPGNLTEMASVVQRAVILGKSHEPLNQQIILGVPKSEGKWEFNLLRLKTIRTFFASRLFPVLPRAIVGVFFVLVLAALFVEPDDPHHNIGLTLSWVVGWPLLIFSFFFLARTWCSICGLSVPGWLAQFVLKPQRPTPQFIRHYSGWIMTTLCILLFWIETTWNAYESPRLTGWIILTITLSALMFSMFFKRRVWCRYLCPLGAINALFSMPAILELRSNAHMCMNRCTDHLCFHGDDDAAGCPMFRHPFLVDNNRDCILCGQCVKNCKLNSIHLNLRLAPQELWNLQSPRLEDSVLVVSLAAIFYPFAINQTRPGLMASGSGLLQALGLPATPALATAIFFFGCILIYLTGYTLMSAIMARLTGNSWKTTASILGYGMIPLVLGAFMAAHLEILVGGIWLLPANLFDLFGLSGDFRQSRMMSRDTTFVLQAITVFGGLVASLYATKRIILRLLLGRRYALKIFLLPAALLCLSALAYLHLA